MHNTKLGGTFCFLSLGYFFVVVLSSSSLISLKLQAGFLCSQYGEDVEVQHCVKLGAGYAGCFFLVPEWS